MKAYILIKIRTGEVKQVVKQLRKLEAVKSAEMTFGPYDAIAVVENGDVSKLGSLLASEIQPIPGIEQTLTCLAVDV
ncbi:MAG: Lrp/AsnC ligand binding domain-containing protein [Chloroflexi bacterium]|nr:Lrp/AsnC ligand binding domain-containing protein [Chloroflexota bacterium]